MDASSILCGATDFAKLQMLTARAIQEEARILLIYIDGKEIDSTPVEQLILKYYFPSHDVRQPSHQYRSLLTRVKRQEDELEGILLSIFELGLELFGEFLPPLTSKFAKPILSKVWPHKTILRRRLKSALTGKRDEDDQLVYEKDEVDLVLHWFDHIISPSHKSLRLFQEYYESLGRNLRTILLSLIRKSGISTLILLVDEADDFEKQASGPRTSFENHYSGSNSSSNLNFYYIFFCLPSTVQTLRQHRASWGFVRRYLGPTEAQELSVTLESPTIDTQLITAHLQSIATLYTLEGKTFLDVSPNDIQSVTEALTREKQQNPSLSWHGYWGKLIEHIDSKKV
jgi:hypothetical protein